MKYRTDLKTDLALRDYLLPGEQVKLEIYNRTGVKSEYYTKWLKYASKLNGRLFFNKTKNGPNYSWDRSDQYLFRVVIL